MGIRGNPKDVDFFVMQEQSRPAVSSTTLRLRLTGHQGKSERRPLLCYAGRKSPSRQLDDVEIVMLNSSFIQTRRPVTPASLLLSF